MHVWLGGGNTHTNKVAHIHTQLHERTHTHTHTHAYVNTLLCRPDDYTSFLAKNPDGRIVPGERVIKSLGTETAIDEGSYIFEVVSVLL